MDKASFRKCAAVVSLIGGGPDSTVASVRIARYAAERLGVPAIFPGRAGAQELAEIQPRLKVLMLVNGPLLYIMGDGGKPGSFSAALCKAVEKTRHVVWMQNDYTLPPPAAESEAESPFRRAFADRGLVPHYWTTCTKNISQTKLSRLVNWNLLTYNGFVKPVRCHYPGAVLYYGAFREGRALAFDRYMLPNKGVRPGCIVVSSTSKKFEERYGKSIDTIPAIPKDRFYQTLGSYGAGLYLEDKRSHEEDHSMPNRFFEMLSAHLPMVFEPESMGSLERNGFDVTPFVADNLSSAKKLISGDGRSRMLAAQRKWRRDYRAVLDDHLSRAASLLRSAI